MIRNYYRKKKKKETTTELLGYVNQGGEGFVRNNTSFSQPENISFVPFICCNDGWIDNEKYQVYTVEYHSDLEKEILPFSNNMMNLEDTALSEIKQSQKDKESMIPLHEEYKEVRVTETENRTVLPRTWEDGMESCYSKRFSLARLINSKDLLYNNIINSY